MNGQGLVPLLLIAALATAVPAAATRPAPQVAAEVPGAAGPALRSLPELDASGMEAAVGERLAAAQRAITALAGTAASDPQRAGAYGNLGRIAFFYALDSLAEPALVNATLLAPDDFRWAYLLGALYQRQRRLEEAATTLEAALALRPEDPAARLRLAQVRLLAGEAEKARPLLEDAAAEAGTAAAALYALGRLAAEAGDPANAVARYRAALEHSPEAAEVHQQLGLALRDLGDRDTAREHLAAAAQGRPLGFADPLIDSLASELAQSDLVAGHRALKAGLYDEAARRYGRAVTADPSNASYREAYAGALSQAGDLDGAAREYAAAVALAPDDAMARLRLAAVLEERDGVTSEEALGELQKAVELAPEMPVARRELAWALLRRDRAAEAAPQFARAADLDPSDLATRVQWARLLLRLGEEERALAELDRVITLDPGHVDALLVAGRARLARGDDATALAHFEQVLGTAAEGRDRGLAHLQIARLLERRGESGEALSHLRTASELMPRYRPAHEELTAALARAGRTGEAAVVAERARALAAPVADDGEAEATAEAASHPALADAAERLAAGDAAGALAVLEAALSTAPSAPGAALVAFNAALLHQRQGEVERAAELYRWATTADPGLTDAHFNLGTLLGVGGDFAGAAHHFARAVELAPADPEARLGLATAYASAGRYAEAAAALREASDLLPGDLRLTHALARLLAAAPDPAVRDPAAALPLARKVFADAPGLEQAETLALALAGAGQVAEAAAVQSRLVADAEAAGAAPEVLARLRADLERYQALPSPQR